YSYVNEQLTLSVVTSAQTNDRGEYRLFGLPPGRYYVKAAGVADGLIMAATAGVPGPPLLERGDFVNFAEKFVPVYFPGTVDSKSAESIELRAGADFGGVDLTVVKARTHRLRGSVTDGITGRPAASAIVSLTSLESGLNMPGGRVDSEGKLEVQNVLPGSYFLTAALRAGAERPLSGRIPVVVGDADLDNLSIVMSPGLEIPGQIIFEGSGQRAVDSHPFISLQSGRAYFDGGEFSNNTTFTMHNVVEGDYDLRIDNVGQNQYVKSIRFGS